MHSSSKNRWLPTHASDRAIAYSLVAFVVILGLTALKLASTLSQLDQIDQSITQNILIEHHLSDLRGYSQLANRLALTPNGAAARDDLIAQHDSATVVLSERHQQLSTVVPEAISENVGYQFAKLLALAALLRDPPTGLPTMDIADQARIIAEVNLPDSMHNWQGDLIDDAHTTRNRVKLILALFAGSVLLAAILLWRFVLRPLSRTVQDGTKHTRALEDALQHNTIHDRLTGLPNRKHAADLMDRHLSRRRKASVGLLHLDLYQFRAINEELGHEIGDQVLIQTAQRLSSLTSEREFVARIGGDEFLILTDDVASADQLEVRAQEIRQIVREEIQLPTGSRQVDCMIGAVWSPNGMTDAASLNVRADIALHAAETGEDGPMRLFTPAMQEEVSQRDALGRELRTALGTGQLVVYFQPQICARTAAVAGFEALIRWQHPTRGLLAPGAFLRIAEEMGFADQIGAQVLDQALDAWQGWAAAGFDVPHVAVNYSSAQLADALLADRIKWALDRRDLSPDCLALEVVETVDVDSDEALAVRTIRNLAAAGIAIELDDFGTGHASIANIRRFCVSRIKIDRSFITGIDTRKDLAAMADAMVRMASALGVGTIAEGVETASERAAIIELGCDALQGYNIARPMPFDDSLQWLSQQHVLKQSRNRTRQTA
ncbi:diguanylate cyclase (GGDEF) domain-containing protein [Monaibacterium marinum]|uniref:Diguanylate cyclase (GGDEF) domain-containing protein n=1 Tax=Pontivivens marinum TaxID=1690039 RepID=A0A2C9CSU2_9RHOB|nr:diguanylate cyclase (GGDEF) domain-containing protein [Monaibacterium marinum]